MAEHVLHKAAELMTELTAEQLITENLDIWATAIEQKSASGRGSSKKFSLYGIKKLRELILELAVRGKLVPQDANEEPASITLNHPQVLKRSVIKLGKGKALDVARSITDLEKRYALPHGWEWARLGKVIEVTGGSQPPKSKFVYEPQKDYVRLVQIRDFKSDANLTYVPAEFANRPFKETDIMIGRYGPPVFQILRGLSGTYNVALMKAEPIAEAFSNDYLFWLLSEPVLQKLIVNESERTAGQSGVRKELIFDFVIGLPPLEEQQRIVAKVDELMSLCDALEAQTEASKSAHQTLVETLLGALLLPSADANSPEPSFDNSLEPSLTNSFAKDWQRVAEHFDTLFTTSASIDTLKQTILQLAVMGKLVEQDTNDEPAAKLLERIAAEKAQLIRDKKIKKQKPLPAITDEEKPFALPNGWEWVRFGNLVNFKAELVRPEEFLDYDQVAPDSIEKGTGKLLKRRTVRDSGVKGPNSRFYAGQILYSKIRPSLSKAVIAEFDGLCSADMYPLQSMINSQYLLKSILSEVFLEQVRIAENRIKMPKLNIDSLSDIKLPLAPAEEQHRIVAKVDELMALCDQLKARLTDAQTTQLHITDAIVVLAI